MDLNLPMCECGAGHVVLKTSHTTNNPEHKFLCCPNGKKVITNFCAMFMFFVSTSCCGDY